MDTLPLVGNVSDYLGDNMNVVAALVVFALGALASKLLLRRNFDVARQEKEPFNTVNAFLAVAVMIFATGASVYAILRG